MNLCSKPLDLWTLSSHALNFSGSPIVAERPLKVKKYEKSRFGVSSANYVHDRTGREQDNLLPNRSAFVLTDGVYLVQYDPVISRGQYKWWLQATKVLPPNSRGPRSRQGWGKEHNPQHLGYRNKNLAFLRIMHTIVSRVYSPTCTCNKCEVFIKDVGAYSRPSTSLRNRAYTSAAT